MRIAILALLALAALVRAIPAKDSNPLWYDQGLYGAYPWREYESFDLASPRVNILSWSTQCDQSYTFLEPRGRSVSSPGPMILDADGDLVYMEKKFGEAMDFRPQKFKGEDYLTFWSGTDDGTHGRGTYYMLDSSYEIKYQVKPAGGLDGDLHEFQITDNGTALMTIYDVVPADLSSVGGPASGWIYDGLFQEVDIETGELIFEWRASGHYRVDESFAPLNGHGSSQDNAWDYFHINSVDKDREGNYYISSRYTHTVTCISPTGAVLWKLGGINSSFTDLSHGAASNFTWQHHVRWHESNTLTIFDNGAYDNNKHVVTADYSRGLLVQLDLTNMTATLLAALVNPIHILAHSQGSVQTLDNGNIFVGWGHSAAFTEFTRDGEVLCDVHYGSSAFFGWGWVKSYRAYKGNWVGQPKTQPDIVRRGSKVHVSWNGATEVRSWKLQSATTADAEDDQFEDVQTMPKEGFERSFYLSGGADKFVRVAALDSKGKTLGVSKVMDTRSGSVVSGPFSPIQDNDLVPLQFLLIILALVSIGALARAFYVPVSALARRCHRVLI